MPESAIALHVTGTDCDSNGRFQAVFRLGPRPVMNSLTRIPTDELIGTKGLWITHGLGSRTAGVSVKDNAQAPLSARRGVDASNLPYLHRNPAV